VDEIQTIDELYIAAAELGEKVNAKFGPGTAWKIYQEKANEVLRFHNKELMDKVIAELEERLKEK
jgi:accessory colonization factor AcfC